MVTSLYGVPGVLQKFFLNRLRGPNDETPKGKLALRCIALGAILAFPFGRAAAQTTNIPARIAQAVDERNLVVLPGNVHPLARLEFDQGAVADAQPLQRMLLLLQRSPDQEAALRKLLDDQQSKASPKLSLVVGPLTSSANSLVRRTQISRPVTQWLTSQGFTDIKVGPGRTVIEFSAMWRRCGTHSTPRFTASL